MVRTVELRVDGGPPFTVHEMPVKVEHTGGMGGESLTALVFNVPGDKTAVTILMSDGDKRDVINLLRRK
jgi:hypothetical protein